MELVFLPKMNSQWIGLENCIWDGPACMKKTPRVKAEYPDREGFFVKRMGLRYADMNSAVAEVKQITSTDKLSYIRAMFKQLSN